jgi:hypothetical protein
MADATSLVGSTATLNTVVALIGSVSGLAGVVVGAALASARERRQGRKRRLSYWSAISAEVEECKGLAEAYVRDSVSAPLYRLPTLAYNNGFPALLGDGAVSEEETRAILRFYSQVTQINRGLEYAHAATDSGVPPAVLARQADRLLLKARNLFDPACRDPGGPYYERVRAAIDPHVRSERRVDAG